MSKRKRPPAPEPEVAPQAGPESAPEEPPYEVRSWNNLPQYVCRECGFDTLRLPAMVAHVAEQHGPPAPPREPTTLVVTDRFGNVVEEREV